ncbi:hypothetical protein FA95DRAFT_1657538 [Auriscalpium vulgare]|uniref:Uncharacterized protein n=1 Tax=Auriscalpium vulgare TaxID=40419 RepID=A0ACB8R4Y6_9AGAM|nr:hypothetical protein FA95DRAFT_1657538 [Auriscalpium vulgare]
MCRAMPYNEVNALQDEWVPHGGNYYLKSVSLPRPSAKIAIQIRDAVYEAAKANPDIHTSTTFLSIDPSSRTRERSTVASTKHDNDMPDSLRRVRKVVDNKTKIAQQQQPQLPPQQQQPQQPQYPAHPGPIALPPPSAFPQHALSPTHHPQIHPLGMATPHAARAAPITPSMPSFLLVPAAGMPFINLAVGMPVNNNGSGGDHFMGIDPGYFPLILGSGSVQGKGGSGLAHKILKGAEKHSAKVNGIASDEARGCAVAAAARVAHAAPMPVTIKSSQCRPELKVDVFWEDKVNNKEREKRNSVDGVLMQRSGSDPV